MNGLVRTDATEQYRRGYETGVTVAQTVAASGRVAGMRFDLRMIVEHADRPVFVAFHRGRFDGIAVTVAQDEIRADMARGVVPASVGSFSELHDYVDANEYGHACDLGGAHWDELVARMNSVQDAVDAWLFSGRVDG